MSGKSYITEQELAAIALTLADDPPWLYRHVSQTQLSVARHYGGCTVQGHLYTYFPSSDELIRGDVLKLVTSLRKLATKVQRDAAKAPQGQGELL